MVLTPKIIESLLESLRELQAYHHKYECDDSGETHTFVCDRARNLIEHLEIERINAPS